MLAYAYAEWEGYQISQSKLFVQSLSAEICCGAEVVWFHCAGFGRKKEKKGFFDWYFNSRKPKEPPVMARTTPMRIEPKTFFANERTFLSWLHMAVTIGSIAAALLGFVGVADSSKHKAQVSCFLKSASWIIIAALCCWLSMLLNLQCDWVLQTHLVPLLLSDYFPLWCVPPVSLLYLLCISFSTVFDCNIASFPVFVMFCRCIPHGFSVCHMYIGGFPPVFACAFGWITCWNASSGNPSNYLHIHHLCLCWHLVFSLLMMPPCAISTGHGLPGGNHRADPAASGCDDVRLRAHRLHLARACHIQEAGALSGPDLPNHAPMSLRLLSNLL